jgi:hypothetical protein
MLVLVLSALAVSGSDDVNTIQFLSTTTTDSSDFNTEYYYR